MANDRIMVQCTACKHTSTLAKYWGGGEFRLADPTSIEGRASESVPIDAWLEQHIKECHRFFGQSLKQTAFFELVTESTS